MIARFRHYDLLVRDDSCYLPLAQHEAELLFQVLDERSELTALVVTTNLPFSEWTNEFVGSFGIDQGIESVTPRRRK